MRAVIIGCGRVGAGLAERLARAGHDVTIVDIDTDDADYFFALTEGDNRNAFAAQLAAETFDVENVVAKINDPVRAEAYTMLGLSTICRTRLLVDALAQYTGLPGDEGAAGVRTAEGHHAHHDGTAPALQSER